MKFTQFLIEQDQEDKELDQWMYAVAKDCKPAITAAGGPLEYGLYRGMPVDQPALHKQVRTSRKPKDTEEKMHKVMDHWFYENYGIRYRTNAIAGTGDPSSAEYYGTPYLTFPVGQFSFIWSPDLIDIGADVDGRMPADSFEYSMGEYVEQIEAVLNKARFFHNEKFHQALESGHEIMIHTNEYYAINTHHFADEHILESLNRQYIRLYR